MDRIETNFRLALMAVNEVKTATSNTNQKVGRIDKRVDSLSQSVEGLKKSVGDLSQSVGGLSQSVGELRESTSETVEGVNRLAGALTTAFQAFSAYNETQQSILDRLSNVEADIEEIKKNT